METRIAVGIHRLDASDDPAIDDRGGSTVVIEGGDAEDRGHRVHSFEPVQRAELNSREFSYRLFARWFLVVAAEFEAHG